MASSRTLAVVLLAAALAGCSQASPADDAPSTAVASTSPSVAGPAPDAPANASRLVPFEALEELTLDPYPDRVPATILHDNCLNIRTEGQVAVTNATIEVTWTDDAIPRPLEVLVVAGQGQYEHTNPGSQSPVRFTLTNLPGLDENAPIHIAPRVDAQGISTMTQVTVHVIVWHAAGDLLARTGSCSFS